MNKNNSKKDVPMDAELLNELIELSQTGIKLTGAANISYPRGQGGTGFLNINNNNNDGRALVTVLKEIGCDCLFAVPFPVCGIFPFLREEQVLQCLRTEIPPYLSVHQIPGASVECVRLFKQLMVQELATGKDRETELAADSSEMQALDILNHVRKL